MALAFVGVAVGALETQNLSLARAGAAIGARATGSGLGLLQGETLALLKDGRSVRVDVELSVLPGPGGSPTASARQVFILSYDLWEERFAVTLAGPPPQSVSYLTAGAAEAWCLEHVTIPIGELGKLQSAPFWMRLEYRVLDGNGRAARDEDSGLTLRGMIEALSRRPKATGLTDTVEAGPFRIGS